MIEQFACFATPTVAADALYEWCGVRITKQAACTYDLTKTVVRDAARPDWVDLFDRSRKAFIKHIDHVPMSHKAVRIQRLASLADKAERNNHLVEARLCIEQIAKEVGDVYTNRREITGADGSPLIDMFGAALDKAYGSAPESDALPEIS